MRETRTTVNRPLAYPHTPDDELVRLAQAGDTVAFDELVRRFRPGLVLVARRIVGSACAAEDVAQDALALAHRSLPTLADAESFPAWLRTIARNRALRVRYQSSRLAPVEQEALDAACAEGCDAADPQRAVLDRAGRDSVTAMVAALPDELCSVITLHYWHQWPVARIARFLSLPLATVKWRMHRGRRLLTKQLAAELEE